MDAVNEFQIMAPSCGTLWENLRGIDMPDLVMLISNIVRYELA